MQWKTLAAVLLILAGAGVAGAGQIGLRFIDDSPTRTGHVYGGGLTGGNYYIGQSNFTLLPTLPAQSGDVGPRQHDPATGGTDFIVEGDALWLYNKAIENNNALSGYCIDTYQTINLRWPDVWDVYAISSVNVPTGVTTLYKNLTGETSEKKLKAEAKVKALEGLFANYLSTVDTADEAAAMAAAVWEIVNETPGGGYNVKTGDFYVGGAMSWLDTANTWLSNLNISGTTKTPLLYALVDPVTQDFIIAFEGSGSTIPEPFTMLTASLAIGGLGMYVRRRSGRSGLAG